MPIAGPDIAAAAELACRLEATAPKPGNVSPGLSFKDLRFEDFLAAAAAIGPAMSHAADRPIGLTVFDAVQASMRVVHTNSNLGIVLLIVPLARAAGACEFRDGLRDTLGRVLHATTVADARDVYRAIRMASPGGLGSVPDQDVADDPTEPLVEVMRLGAAHDDVAREYATTFATTFETGLPALRALRQQGFAWNEAIVQTYLTILAARPDTHIARRAGRHVAADVSQRAARVLELGGVTTVTGREAVQAFDKSLRDSANTANPGTSADLTTAAIFALLVSEQLPSSLAPVGHPP
jgi:triphosphoribosyl-dephospho-CoA synthase